MNDNFMCPGCGHDYSIGDLEMWDLYGEDGKETEFTCKECEVVFIITTIVEMYSFETQEID